jgi:hypothetical protein
MELIVRVKVDAWRLTDKVLEQTAHQDSTKAAESSSHMSINP